MKTTEIQQTSEIEIDKVTFKNAIVSNIELKNGKQTQIITIFNSNEINFEEMVIGVNTTIRRQSKFYNNIKSIQNTFNEIENGKLKPFTEYKKQEFKTPTNIN